MDLVAIHAANVIHGVRAADPVASLFVAPVATEARSIGFGGRALAESHDFRDVAAAVHVQAA